MNDVSHLLTHSEAVIVNELDMNDCPSFKLTKTSRVLERKREKKVSSHKTVNKSTYIVWRHLYAQTPTEKVFLERKTGVGASEWH